MTVDDRARGTVCGLAAAALFGASAPIAKLLLPSTGPLALAALLYLGAAAGLWLVRALGGAAGEAKLRRSDLPTLAAVSLIGGVAGPLLLLVGLARLSAVAGALLLNLEAPFTIAVAALAFGEHAGRRVWAAATLIVTGSLLLAYQPGAIAATWPGALAVAGACACWGLDNNLTQRLSVRDPQAIVRWKALVAGGVSWSLAAATGQRLPPVGLVGGALALGAVSYGASIVLDVYALRLLGAAREAALFATAPFVGALLGLALFRERPDVATAGALALMAGGTWLLARERHGHQHTHDALAHDHLHTHDAHHQHPHPPGVVIGEGGEPHAHPHQHAPLTHDHPHVPDLHHRHRH